MSHRSITRSLCLYCTYAVLTAGSALSQQPAETVGTDESPREFFGLEVTAHRVIFVLDHSKSMLSYTTRQTRLDRLRDEMSTFFEQTDGEQYFDLLCFNDRLDVFRRQLVHTDEQTVAEAEAFLKQQTARGQTATFDALKSALIEGHEQFADRIILLTDGHPTTGSIVEPSAILRAIRTMNAEAKIPIDVIEFDTKFHPQRRAFLKQLAYENQGQFVETR